MLIFYLYIFGDMSVPIFVQIFNQIVFSFLNLGVTFEDVICVFQRIVPFIWVIKIVGI